MFPEIVVAFLFCCLIFIFTRNQKKKKQRQLEKKQRQLDLIQSVTSLDRGTSSERNLILNLLEIGIPEKSIFHDLYLERYNNKYSQIDLVVPTRVGILVFEVKDYSGWIYGKGNQDKWTQVLSYGREKHHFYNPIKQNKYHIQELQRKLKENVPFFSIIVFYGNSELQDISFIPQGTFVTKWYRVGEVISSIFEHTPPACYKDKQNVVRILKEAVKNGDKEGIDMEHIENIKDMIGKERIFD